MTPWLLVAGLTGVGIWVAVDALGNDDLPTPTVNGSTPTPTPEPKRSTEPSPSPEPAEPSPTPEPGPEETPEPKTKLITENMTVQVLNGTADPSQDDAMANQLSSAGFEVVAIQGSSREYPATTVFWSYAESQEAAELLAERYGWEVAPKPDNLSTQVALHVVVGLDYAPE